MTTIPSPSISAAIDHAPEVPLLEVARVYAAAMERAGQPLASFTVQGMGDQVYADGDVAAFADYVRGHGAEDRPFALLKSAGGLKVSCWRWRAGQKSEWSIEISWLEGRRLTVEQWLHLLVDLARSVVEAPGFVRAQVHRGSLATPDFPLFPPLAGANHLVTVTDAGVAEAYDRPDAFWHAWDEIEAHGDIKVCVRALDQVGELEWLGRTFEDSMEMARAARPGKTRFCRPVVSEWMGPWWEFGDPQREKAGEPVLSPVGYDPATRTVEYSGFVPPGQHVLIQEIQNLRVLLRKKKDPGGRSVDAVRVVFFDEAMARAEKRPLLDIGVRVYFMDPATGGLVELTE